MDLLCEARRAFQASRGSTRGPWKLSADDREHIAIFLATDPSIQSEFGNDDILLHAGARLIAKTQEAFIRHELPFEGEVFEESARQLITELKRNAEAFKLKPDKVVSATFFNADSLHLIPTDPEIAQLGATLHDLGQVVISWPRDPREFLRAALEQYLDIVTSDEFSDFSAMPGTVRRIVLHYPADPKGFLRDVQSFISGALEDESFSFFWDHPGILREAAIDHVNERREYLERVKSGLDNLETDPRFTGYPQSVLLNALVYFSGNPQAALLHIGRETVAILNDPEYAYFRDAPGVVMEALVHRPKSARAFLKSVEDKVEELFSSYHPAAFSVTKPLLKHVVINHFNDTRHFLETAEQAYREIATEAEFTGIPPSLLREAVLQHPKSARQFLRRRSGAAAVH